MKRDVFDLYRRNGRLIYRKLLEFVPIMTVTNLTVLLISSADSIVVGRFLGTKAVAAVQFLLPYSTFVGIVSDLIASGAGGRLSLCMGRNDAEGLERVKRASGLMTAAVAVFLAVAQIPLAVLMINLYDMTPEVRALAWQYVVGMMIGAPLGFLSTVGTRELSSIGRMKAIMLMSMLEGAVNVVMDLFFVGFLRLSVAGAGYGTAVANLVRAGVTWYYIRHKTDLISRERVPVRQEIGSILRLGLPNAATTFALAVQSTLITWLLARRLSVDGLAAYAVCTFCNLLILVVLIGVSDSVRPLFGLLGGSGDRHGMHMLLREALAIGVSLVGVITLCIELFPGAFFRLYGLSADSARDLLALRLYALYFVFKAFNRIMRDHFTLSGDKAFSARTTLLENCVLPCVFALLLSRFASSEAIFLSWVLSGAVVFCMTVLHYRRRKPLVPPPEDNAKETLFLSCTSKDGSAIAEQLQEAFEAEGMDAQQAYHLALCLEEMVAYAQPAKGEDAAEVLIMIRRQPDTVQVSILDDGQCIRALKLSPEELAKAAGDNYALICSIAEDVTYQYVMNMNYTSITVR